MARICFFRPRTTGITAKFGYYAPSNNSHRIHQLNSVAGLHLRRPDHCNTFCPAGVSAVDSLTWPRRVGLGCALCRAAASNSVTQYAARIWARQLDLRHENEVRSLCEELKSRGLRLGVIDTSDVPNGPAGGTSVAAQYVHLISQYAPDSAIFLNTAPTRGQGVRWSYFGFSNKTIRGRDLNTIKRWY